MKDKYLRDSLSEYAGTPDYIKKDEFIRKMRKRTGDVKVSTMKMILTQARYIRIYIWILSALMFVSPLFGAFIHSFVNPELVTRLMPFFAGFGVFEALRAKMHKMDELEAVTLLSGKGVFFARMTAIGVVQFFVIAFISIMFSGATDGSCLYMAVQLLLPYTITNTVCFILERTSFGRDNVWSCIAVSGIVFALRETVIRMPGFLRIDRRAFVFSVSVLLAIQFVEFNKTVKTERFTWN
ncbi:MAG: hypothetical protein IJ065_12410 [Eubacterium sp.]|nr:hypothetical protein [Eubacterium sp.]